MKKTTNKKASAKRKLIPAFGSLMISAAMLSTSTYAWFTMNKEVSVTGMEVKAHAEEGLLINEVKAASSNTWDEQATGGQTALDNAISLRPASTYNLDNWWHASSKQSSIEAGVDNTEKTVDVDASGNKYIVIDESATGTQATKYDLVAAASAEGNVKAETNVFYKDASFGTANSYQDGEGFYVKYTYYLKSSGSETLSIAQNALQAKVKVTKMNEDTTDISTNLDKSLRVGVKYNASNYAIFAPLGGDSTYSVTTKANGTTTQAVTFTRSETGETAYAAVNVGGAVTIAPVTGDATNHEGTPVYVYVWFEGEDSNCKSDNLTAVLDTYKIDVTFQDTAIGGTGTPANSGD